MPWQVGDPEERGQREPGEPAQDQDCLPGRPGVDQLADHERRSERAQAEKQVEQVQGPALTSGVQVEEQPVAAAIDRAGAESAGQRGEKEELPRRDEALDRESEG